VDLVIKFTSEISPRKIPIKKNEQDKWGKTAKLRQNLSHCDGHIPAVQQGIWWGWDPVRFATWNSGSMRGRAGEVRSSRHYLDAKWCAVFGTVGEKDLVLRF